MKKPDISDLVIIAWAGNHQRLGRKSSMTGQKIIIGWAGNSWKV